MRKNSLLRLSMALILPFFMFSCEKEIDAPEPDFSATISGSNTLISVSFKDKSTNSPETWYWTFEGGYPSTSTEKNPTVTYSTNGTYNVTLSVGNKGGENETTEYDYINIVRFNNQLFTDIDVTIDGITKTMSPDSYVLFGQTYYTSVTYSAQTSGKTTSGTQVGLLISWDNSVDLNTYSSYNLIITSTYAFFYITNTNATYTLTPFYVNWGNTTERTIDNIEIPNNGVKYRTGYYKTFSGMQVRAYYKNASTLYAYWINPTNLTIPWTNNQYVNLTFSKSFQENSDKELYNECKEIYSIYPAIDNVGSKLTIDKNAKDLPQSNK